MEQIISLFLFRHLTQVARAHFLIIIIYYYYIITIQNRIHAKNIILQNTYD